MMDFMSNDWNQHDIIDKIKILTKRGTDTIHSGILTKYQKYPSTTKIKHANILDNVNKVPYGCLPNMTPHDAYSITTHLHKVNLAEISHEQKV